jgi:hypothetical protein
MSRGANSVLYKVCHQSPLHASFFADSDRAIMFSLGQYCWPIVFRWRSLFEGCPHATSGHCLRSMRAPTSGSVQLETKEFEVIPHNVTSVRYLLVAIRLLLRMTDVLPIAAPTAKASTSLAAVARRTPGRLLWCDVRGSV